MVDDTILSWGNVSANVEGVSCPELSGNVGEDALYLPVEFLDDMRLFCLPPQQQKLFCDPRDTKLLHPGSVLLTGARILLALAFDPTDGGGCGLTNGATAAQEAVVFSDVADAVTTLRRWISDASGRTLCYQLELLGGAHNIIFRPDETRVVSFYGAHGESGATVGEVLLRWARGVEEFIGQSIETVTWAGGSGDGFDGVGFSSLSWGRLREGAAGRRGRSSPLPNQTNMSSATHLSLIPDDGLARRDIFLVRTLTTTRAAAAPSPADVSEKPAGAGVATPPWSWRDLLTSWEDIPAHETGTAEEVVRLLEEEEALARMELGLCAGRRSENICKGRGVTNSSEISQRCLEK